MAETAPAVHRPGSPVTSSSPFVLGPTDLANGAASGPLLGKTFAVKDLYDVAGTKTGDGNPARLAEARVAQRTAPIIEVLIDAGAALVGKTITDELAFSLSGTNVHYGTPDNPAAPGRVPGGSSSGSASAVAGGLVDFALGTDTGGSTRVPASYCGLYGLRLTHGLCSSDGVFLLAPSFCAPGVFSRDTATLSSVCQALLASDAVTERPVARAATELVLAPELFQLADPAAGEVLDRAAHELAERWGLPISVESFSQLGAPDELLGTFRTIQMYEAWQLHGSWVSAHIADLGPGIAGRFQSASGVTTDEVSEARTRRAEFRRRFATFLGDGRYLLQPATSGVAPLIELDGAEKDDLRRRTMMLTAPAGLAGAPVVTLPVGLCGGLPVGVALVGRPGDDGTLVGLAHRQERKD